MGHSPNIFYLRRHQPMEDFGVVLAKVDEIREAEDAHPWGGVGGLG